MHLILPEHGLSLQELRLGSVKWCGVQVNGVDRADRLTQL